MAGAGALAVKRFLVHFQLLFSLFHAVNFKQGISGAWYSIAEFKDTAIESRLNTLESSQEIRQALDGHGDGKGEPQHQDEENIQLVLMHI
jgi:hypothetical protein